MMKGINVGSKQLARISDWASSHDAVSSTHEQEEAFRRAIFAIPAGKVSSYGGIAMAAGFPHHHRAVARLLRQDHLDQLPWHRVVGADGQIKTSGASAKEQKARLRAEGVKFEGKRVMRTAFVTPRDAMEDCDARE